MFKKVAGTVITRLITAVVTLTMVIVNARYLGPEKVGIISLVLLAITIINHGQQLRRGSCTWPILRRGNPLPTFTFHP